MPVAKTNYKFNVHAVFIFSLLVILSMSAFFWLLPDVGDVAYTLLAFALLMFIAAILGRRDCLRIHKDHFELRMDIAGSALTVKLSEIVLVERDADLIGIQLTQKEPLVLNLKQFSKNDREAVASYFLSLSNPLAKSA